MPAPAMPATMRGDGRGTRLQPKKAVGRYFPGKGDDRGEHSETDEEEDEDGLEVREEQKENEGDDDPGSTDRKKANIQLKDVNLQRHYEQERILEAQRIELEAINQDEDSASAYETENSQDESNSGEEEEEEERPRRVLLKPTFISKSQRLVPPTQDGKATTKSDEAPLVESLDDAQKRRLEARGLLEQETRLKAQQVLDAHHEDGSDINDTDDPSSAESDRVAWKLRELLRIKRDRDVLEAREREREEIEERKRELPEEERLLQDIQRVTKEREEKVESRRAERELVGSTGATKYHHRGGFYQDDPVVARAMTGRVEDTQANQGVKGANASRWNGLVQQDTTTRDSIWSDARDPGVKRTVEKMGGMKDQFNPQKKKRV